MTADHDSSSEYDDSELLSMLDSLNLDDPSSDHPLSRPRPPLPVPRTPSPPPPHASNSFGHSDNLAQLFPDSPTVYQFESPTRSGITDDWATAGTATQGVPGGRVRALASPKKNKKHTGHKAGYAVFCGVRCGVFRTWAETGPLVLGVPNCIFRGYATIREAEAAFSYAQARGWTRVANTAVVATISQLPVAGGDPHNPLNGSEELDGRWYVVYRGISPGVYRSHLESQLNTMGVRGALYESINGEAQARAKYAKAVRNHKVAVVTPTYIDIELDADPFV
ncbi:hypothetical protein B0H11DRAFT_2245003 [Mycena galericulata]|nr:hypothetical protein B0H11DRAFT_2245003 [Mycena galericulata]